MVLIKKKYKIQFQSCGHTIYAVASLTSGSAEVDELMSPAAIPVELIRSRAVCKKPVSTEDAEVSVELRVLALSGASSLSSGLTSLLKLEFNSSSSSSSAFR